MHVRKDLAEAFLGQRPTIMRLGGSMTNVDGFRFADQVGPPWQRPPTDSSWIKHTSWGFGMTTSPTSAAKYAQPLFWQKAVSLLSHLVQGPVLTSLA